MRNSFIDTIIRLRGEDENFFMITGDGGFGVFDDFWKNHPERFLNMGISEQNTMSLAAGLSMSGFKVLTYNIVPFVLYRCYEQVRNDICYQRLPVILTGIGSGVTYAPAGMTHYSVEDIGISRTLPNLTVLSPCDPIEAIAAAKYGLDAKGPVYVRLAKRGEPILHKTKDLDISKPIILSEGNDTAIVFHGSIGEEAVKAKDLLSDMGIETKLISIPMVQPLDEQALAQELNGISHVFSIEEHYTNCGLGHTLAAWTCQNRPSFELHVLGIPGGFVHEIKDLKGMRDHFGISAKRIAAKISTTIKGIDQ